MSRSQLASVVSGIALGAWILAVVAGCAARETFLTPKDLSADLQPEKAERLDDAEKLTEAAVRNPIVVCRKQKGRDDRVLIRVSLRKATRNESENIRLMPGDIVSIEPTVTTLMKDSAGYVGAAAAGGGMLLIGGGPH